MKTKTKISIKIISMILVIFSLLSAFTLEVNATNNEEVNQEVGWVHITIDTETNRPDDFRDYNFYVNIVNKETDHWYLSDVYYDNGYKARITLPYGDYYIAEAGVQKDYLGKFALTTGQEFTLDEEVHAVDIQLGFSDYHIIEPEIKEPVEDVVPEEPTEEVPEIQEPVEEPTEDTTPDVEPEQEVEQEELPEEEEDYLKDILVSILKFLVIVIIVGILVYLYKRYYE